MIGPILVVAAVALVPLLVVRSTTVAARTVSFVGLALGVGYLAFGLARIGLGTDNDFRDLGRAGAAILLSVVIGVLVTAWSAGTWLGAVLRGRTHGDG